MAPDYAVAKRSRRSQTIYAYRKLMRMINSAPAMEAGAVTLYLV